MIVCVKGFKKTSSSGHGGPLLRGVQRGFVFLTVTEIIGGAPLLALFREVACRTIDTNFATLQNSGAPGPRDFLGQLAVELCGVDDEALVRAFGNLVDAVVGHD